MQFWKRIVTHSLVITATFISLFWITAFTTEKVAQLESGKTSSMAAISATPIGFSKKLSIKKVNEIILHNGSDDWTCLPTTSHKPSSKYPVRWYTI